MCFRFLLVVIIVAKTCLPLLVFFKTRSRFPFTTMASGTGSLSEKLSGSSAVAAKFSSERTQRSTIWDSFDRIGKGQVKCRHCSKLFAYSSSTSSMRKHLKRIHPSTVNTDW